MTMSDRRSNALSGSDPYARLGLRRGASRADVRRAYRRLAKRFHPDRAGEGDLETFLAIQAAYQRIMDGDIRLALPRSRQYRRPTPTWTARTAPPRRWQQAAAGGGRTATTGGRTATTGGRTATSGGWTPTDSGWAGARWYWEGIGAASSR
jgi:curved DNA-binding protein CbpA